MQALKDKPKTSRLPHHPFKFSFTKTWAFREFYPKIWFKPKAKPNCKPGTQYKSIMRLLPKPSITA